MQILITGASGLLGAYLLREGRVHSISAWGGPSGAQRFGIALRTIDLTDYNAVATAFRTEKPDIVIHAAAMARVADCWNDQQRAHAVNVGATANLAQLCADAGSRLVFVSTDLVFNGENAPYREDANPNPLSIYGQTKREAELAVLAMPRSVVARVSLLYGPALHGKPSFFDEQTNFLLSGKPITLFRDEFRAPLDLTTAARALLALADSDCNGLLHIGGPERLSRLEMGERLARFLKVDHPALDAVERSSFPAPEPRPRDVSLDSSSWREAFPGVPWRSFEEALAQWKT